jgi:hypothetical protein
VLFNAASSDCTVALSLWLTTINKIAQKKNTGR